MTIKKVQRSEGFGGKPEISKGIVEDDSTVVYYEDPALEFLADANKGDATHEVTDAPPGVGLLGDEPVAEIHEDIQDALETTYEEVEEKRALRQRLNELT